MLVAMYIMYRHRQKPPLSARMIHICIAQGILTCLCALDFAGSGLLVGIRSETCENRMRSAWTKSLGVVGFFSLFLIRCIHLYARFERAQFQLARIATAPELLAASLKAKGAPKVTIKRHKSASPSDFTMKMSSVRYWISTGFVVRLVAILVLFCAVLLIITLASDY